MPNLQENRFLLLNSYSDGIINDKKLVLLYIVQKPTTLDFPHWQ